ncbi:MAG: complex I NDUFA9 subunit family protein [Candidatus Rokubacteria bacterium]|nr:complex I NDUFA9 subunit family protein [Candidatus Rokubacteria bacterium]
MAARCPASTQVIRSRQDFSVAQRVFITGGTGFVGKAVIRALQAHGFTVRCLVRPGSEADLKGFEGIDRVPGDVLRPRGLEASIEGCGALIHLVGIIREHPGRGVTFERCHSVATANMVKAAEAAEVRRFLQMSALGTRPDAPSRYHRTKWEAEETVRKSRLEWTIFRPSVIYGIGDGFVSMLARLIKWLPAAPVIGDGTYRLQPVPVDHVAEGFARALLRPDTKGHIYEVGGPRAYAFTEILDLIGKALGKTRVRKVYHPIHLIRPLVRLLEPLSFFPLSSDQLTMLQEDNVCDPAPFFRAFDLAPVEFPRGLERMFGR